MGALIAEEMRAAVYRDTGFSCSAGISHNKVTLQLNSSYRPIQFQEWWKQIALSAIPWDHPRFSPAGLVQEQLYTWLIASSLCCFGWL